MEIHNDGWLAIGMFLLGGMGTVVWFFIRIKLQSYDEQHKSHFLHSIDMSLHETNRERELRGLERESIANQLKEHNDDDDRRFYRLENSLDEIRKDIKEILKVVNKSV
jgi:hypothetical protein